MRYFATHALPVLTGATAFSCAIVGGVFFAFSNFIMRALARVPVSHGVGVMQAMNVTVITPLFMTLLFGAGVTSIVLIATAVGSWRAPYAAYMLAGGILYFVGAVMVTVAYNVPLNNAIDAVPPESVGASRFWRGFLQAWTAWNHVRTIASLGASALFAAAYTRL